MGSKAIAFLGLFFAMVLLISSEVAAARELAQTFHTVETSKEAEKTNGAAVNDAKNHGGVHGGDTGGGGYGGYPTPPEYPPPISVGYPPPPSRYSGYCFYGCCQQCLYGGCCRCCTYAGEKADAEAQGKP